MKTSVSVIAVMFLVTLLGFGVMAYAHSQGGWGGHMMGQGVPMMGYNSPANGYDRKFLDETADLRRELHNKKFEYFEVNRNQGTTPEALGRLEREIDELQKKLYEKASSPAYGKYGGRGCW